MENFLNTKFSLNDSQQTALKAHFEIFMQWKDVHNLTAVHRPEDIYLYHYMDCLLGLQTLFGDLTLNPSSATGEGLEDFAIYDLGSGAGFPGLVAAAIWPDQDIVLVESSSKKCAFLKLAASKMKLNRVKVLNQRVESLINIPYAITRATFSKGTWDLIKKAMAPDGRAAFWLSEQESVEREGWVLERQHYYELEPGHKRQVAVFHVEPKTRK
ncbi:MAG: RsmG family class I SAM-dependent methyltransferase [Myxococcota bacterium]